MAQIRKNKHSWSYRIHKVVNGKDVYQYKSGFNTKLAAKNAAIEAENKILKGKVVNSRISFRDYYMRWFKDVKAGQYTHNTELRYLHTNQLINEYFGSSLLKNITRRDYQAFLNNYAKNHSKESVQKVNSYVREMVDSAIDEGIIYKDFTKRVRNNGANGKKASDKYLNVDDFNKLIKQALNNLSINSITTYMILFGALTGARYAEVCGMTWNNIDFKNKTIHIARAYDYINHTGFKPLKNTSSDRVIAIDDNLIAILKQLKNEQAKYYIKKGYRDNDNLLFRSINNKFTIPTNNAANKTLRQLQKDAGINQQNWITFHGLRHTHASYLISNNIPINYVSKRLGHSDITTTLKTYTHLLNEMEQMNNERTEKLLINLYK